MEIPAPQGHLLNRIAYGPSPGDLQWVEQVGLSTYIAQQLDPATIDESDNLELLTREAALFQELIPRLETDLVGNGTFWRYFKGTQAPPASWRETDFDDSVWLGGATGIGYGDNDDQTVLSDMRRTDAQPGYVSVFLRHTFHLTEADRLALNDLILLVDYDDGFIASLNGVEVARANMRAGTVAYDQTAAGSHEAGTPESFDITAFKQYLRNGLNVLAVQVHNQSPTSSDLSIHPELLSRTRLPGPALQTIKGVNELQQLVHVRGVYARRQLQAVLAEFWENHFTTDVEKLAEYFDALQNSDAGDAMSRDQAEAEAAQVEYREYQFFHDHALGTFGDLLLYSATSPSMLVYLDNVLNVKGAPNENYAREILELSAFGVDNRYTQADIEELGRCFTGWTVVKLAPDHVAPFPQSAREPPTESGVKFEDTQVIDLGAVWRYFKGEAEPSANGAGQPTTVWATPSFDDSNWLRGATGLGYGDGDDATVLSDMRNRYTSVYLRHRFTVDDPTQFAGLILEVGYDDGFVAYLNGTEIARSETMEGRGMPPTFDQTADGSHEVTEGIDSVSLAPYLGLLQPGENVLAVQTHNSSQGSSDLSILPRLLDRRILPGSIENGDRYAVWTFRFDPEQHDTGQKVLYADTPHAMIIPAGRSGPAGVQDALEVVEAMAGHPSTAEYICIKLIQRFVSDRITLDNVKDGTVSPELADLLDSAIGAWQSTTPPGHIATVMETILDPQGQAGYFWSATAYRSKVKTPIEYINSSLRALGAAATGKDLPGRNDAMGMHLFTRDEPDGYSELGFDWMDTATMLERIEFVRALADNRDSDFGWDSLGVLAAEGLTTPDHIVDYFDGILFQHTLSQADRMLVLEFLSTDDQGQLRPLDPDNRADFQQRVQACVGFMLSLPQWHFQ
jgi:hypothetical protein